MNESVAAMLTSAKSRALSTRLNPADADSERTMGFQLGTPVSAQKRPTSVCSGVRALLCRPPTCWISLRSFVHSVVFRAGGGTGRNCAGSFMKKGLTLGQFGLAGIIVG